MKPSGYPVIGRSRPPDKYDHPRLDCRRLTLEPGSTGVLSIEGRPRIAFEVFDARLHVAHDLFGTPMLQRVSLVDRAKGPMRHVFSCPRCSAPEMVLYLRPGPGFVCRECASRLHRSAAAAELHRNFRLQAKIERRLGRSWRRPARMSEEAYKRLLNRLDRLRADIMSSVFAR